MRIIGISRLMKHKVKNRGNNVLCSEIDKLITDIESFQSNGSYELKQLRNDADCVHDDGFYFFDIHFHRALVLIQFNEENTATIVWVGNHQDYEITFKNNKIVIEKWLRSKSYV